MAATDQTTISALTELTAAASGDIIPIDDVSANETKYITAGNLTSLAYAQLLNTSVDQGGTVITLSSLSTTYADITGQSTETGAGLTYDATTGTVTLPSGSAIYYVAYSCGASRASGATSEVFMHVAADGTHVPGSESSISSDGGSGDQHSQSAHTLFSASGGEVLKVQAKLGSGNANTTFDQFSFVVVRISY